MAKVKCERGRERLMLAVCSANNVDLNPWLVRRRARTGKGFPRSTPPL